MYVVVINIVVVVVVATTNAIVNARDVVDFLWCPSNLHLCPHPYVDTPQPLETLYHGPS